MPPPKPRRSTTPALAFEALFYPDLIDRIFEHAPYESLLVLRATCKSWRARSDNLLLKEVIIKSPPNAKSSAQWIATTPNGPIPRQIKRPQELYKTVQHLSVLKEDIPYWIRRMENLQTLRHFPATKGGLCCRAMPSEGWTPFIRQSRGHLALVIGGHTRWLPRFWHDRWSPQSITIIVLPPPPPPQDHRTSAPPLYEGSIFYRLLDFVRDILTGVSKTGKTCPIKIVNLDAWIELLSKVRHEPEQQVDVLLSGFSSSVYFATSSDSVRRWDRACVRLAHFRGLVRFRLSDPIIPLEEMDPLLNTISFKTMDEYREEVGEAQVQWETELVYAHAP